MPDPRNGSWERELEKSVSGLILPDCRLSWTNREQGRVRVGRLVVDRLFCANCGDAAPGGVVPDCPYVFYVCNGCFDAVGRVAPAGTVQVEQ
jgi:hypothetical protein